MEACGGTGSWRKRDLIVDSFIMSKPTAPPIRISKGVISIRFFTGNHLEL